ncbi:MAG: class I SAM-dependent methyltransferase [bacterium]|nr:class I SAM-dependent methyltransferase [bacterium]
MDKPTQKNLLEIVRRNYEDIAEDFDTTRKKALWPELLKLAGVVKDGDRVLDAGCGNGRLLQAFGKKKIEYVGIDNSKELIEAAIKNFQFSIFNFQTNPNFQFSNKIQNAKFVVADVLELDKLPERDFDYVFSIAVLHHLPGEDLRVRALEQIKNKLAPEGRIVLTVWNLWTRKKFLKLILKFGLFKLMEKNKMDCGDILFDWKNSRGESLSQRYYHAFTKHELKKIISLAGLKIEKLYHDQFNYYVLIKSS